MQGQKIEKIKKLAFCLFLVLEKGVPYCQELYTYHINTQEPWLSPVHRVLYGNKFRVTLTPKELSI